MKQALAENTLTAAAGGVTTAVIVAIAGDTSILWGFVTGVFIVSLSLVIGKIVAKNIR